MPTFLKVLVSILALVAGCVVIGTLATAIFGDTGTANVVAFIGGMIWGYTVAAVATPWVMDH